MSYVTQVLPICLCASCRAHSLHLSFLGGCGNKLISPREIYFQGRPYIEESYNQNYSDVYERNQFVTCLLSWLGK